MTSLNLFTTKFDQVLQIVEKRANSVEYDELWQITWFSAFLTHGNAFVSKVMSYLTLLARSRYSLGLLPELSLPTRSQLHCLR